MSQRWILTKGSYADQILILLRDHGPMTATELADAVGTKPKNIRAILVTRRKTPDGARWHISEYRREEVHGRLYPRAVYKFGKGRNAKKPPPLTQTEYNKRYRSRKRSCVTSVFDLGKSIDKLVVGRWADRRYMRRVETPTDKGTTAAPEAVEV